MSSDNVHFLSINEKWKTPEKFYENLNNEFNFDFDPCPSNPEFDGLEVEWGSCNFVNPPYGNVIAKWLEKAVIEQGKGKTSVFLIPSRTDTKWWHTYVMKADEIRFIKGRLRFQGAIYNAPFPSVVVVFKGK
jgi:site-specific DNA-methyltransferase (adenine-specific)